MVGLQGQTGSETVQLSDPISTGITTTNVIVGTAYCERTLAMGSTVKKFSEIFPNECKKVKAEAQPESSSTNWYLEQMAPLVVPAIVVGSHLGYGDCQGACMDHPIADYSCADKSRVLLTTEEGKKICVKF
jgi:hypothetical protein